MKLDELRGNKKERLPSSVFYFKEISFEFIVMHVMHVMHVVFPVSGNPVLSVV